MYSAVVVQSFKGDESTQKRSTVASHQKLTTTGGEQSLKLIFGNRKTYQRNSRRQSFYNYMAFETNWNSEKLSKWVSHELTTNKKCCHFEVLHSLTLCNNNEPFLDWTVMCSEKWILYDS